MNAYPVLRTCAFRPRVALFRSNNAVIGMKRPAYRTFADDKKSELPKAEPGQQGLTQGNQEHVSEEAAKMAKIQGGEGPDIEGQGTPVQEILRNEKEVRQQAPQVMKDQAKNSNITTKPSTRPFSTLARRRMVDMEASSSLDGFDPSMIPSESQRQQFAAEMGLTETRSGQGDGEGHKFSLPALPLSPEMIKKTRYDPLVEQLTNLMMRDGKKSVAQRWMGVILNILRTSNPPKYSTKYQLLPGAPSAIHLPLNPVLYLTIAVDSVAPLLRMRQMKGAAGGGMALQIPVPLSLRQRRRTAFMWILDTVSKRKSRGSGKNIFAQKVAEEIIAVVEGRSTVWDRRNAVHKQGTTARAAVNTTGRSRSFRR